MRRVSVFPLFLLLISCSVIDIPYPAYDGEGRSRDELALVRGEYYYRKDWLNSYVDAVRVQRVDQRVIENSRAWDEVLMQPGMREIEVYYSWDLGARIGLAPAIANYASNSENLSRTLRFNAEAGKEYAIKAAPVFSASPGDLTTLSYVDFWIEDSRGRVVLTREEGRFRGER
ncbi:MAG: hypothetical protein H7A05_11250 [Pseudomonadales bacterium]|nr:hypothetical protein [Pseudomonadales bacterium]MCP5345187.1 hypothetical protein [Pseudomonadales bacterium]MCP5359083.1 hypothetical protein [Pseudomonadales bacterium]